MEIAIIIGIIIIIVLFIVLTPLIQGRMLNRSMNTLKKMTSGVMGSTFKELNKATIQIQKEIMEENYDDLKDLEQMDAEIKSTGIKKKAQAFKEGFESNQVYCKHCGKKIDSDSKFCKYCGLNQ